MACLDLSWVRSSAHTRQQNPSAERFATALLHGQGSIWFVGRLDNRSELWSCLPSPPGPLATLSDTELLAAGYATWGQDLWRRLLGSFVVVVEDRQLREVILARDPMGGRALYYSLTSSYLQVSTEQSHLLVDQRVDTSLDAESLAHYFALESPSAGRTFFRGVRQLPPGHVLRVGAEHCHLAAFWRPTPAPQPIRNAGELAEELRGLLREAVSCRLRSAAQPGVLLSGGLDSTPIAGLARSVLGRHRKLHTFSWIFDRHPRADERRYAQDAARRFNLTPHAVRCDDALPLSDLPFWPVHPTTPEQNAYRWFHQRAYEAAKKAGCDLLLSGMCGDQLYHGGDPHGFDESLRASSWPRALSSLARQTLTGGFNRRHWAALLPWAWRLERLARWPERRYPWLTARAQSQLGDPVAREGWAAAFPRPGQALLLLGDTNGHGFAVERHFAALAGIELAYPLRDRRIIELFLNLPSSWLVRQGETRPLLRRACADLLPASIAARQDKANFTSLVVEGVYRRNAATTRRLLFKADAIWPELVDRTYVLDAWKRQDTGQGGVVLWLAACLELWLERRSEENVSALPLAA